MASHLCNARFFNNVPVIRAINSKELYAAVRGQASHIKKHDGHSLSYVIMIIVKKAD